MEAINDSAKLIAQAIDSLEQLRFLTKSDEELIKHAINILKNALDTLAEEI